MLTKKYKKTQKFHRQRDGFKSKEECERQKKRDQTLYRAV